MVLKKLSIINFKSIRSAQLEFSDNINCFIGNNGMGKTNILDAIHYLSFTKSHLGLVDSFAVTKGEKTTILDAVFYDSNGDTQSIILQIKPGERKVLKRNKKEYQRISKHIGFIPLVIVSPHDNQLITGASELRRRFIDQQLSQQDSVYMNAVVQYNKVLEQRNTLLKENNINNDILQIIDSQLSKYSKYIFNKRKEFIEQFSPRFNEYYHYIDAGKENVRIEYQSQLINTNGELLPILQNSLPKDRLLGYTTSGIHKDDLIMLLDNELVRKVGSQGQTKTFLISLKLSQYFILNKYSITKPIILFDDIFDRLDAYRVEKIISLVAGDNFGQIFITDTNRENIDEIVKSVGSNFKIFIVDNGNTKPIN